MKFIAAIAKALREFLSSTASNAKKTLDSLIKIPGLIFFGVGPRMPSTSPDFVPTTDPRELLAELSNGHASAPAQAAADDPVALIVKFAKTPKSERLQFNLGTLDVAARAKLLTLSEGDLAELSRASRADVEKFFKTPTISARPRMRNDSLALTTPAELQKRVRAFMGSGSSTPNRNPLRR